MQYNRRLTWRIMLVVFVAGCCSVTIFIISSAARTSHPPTQQQDVIRLEQRVNQMEIRLYSMETNLRTLEQQIRLSSGSTRGLDSQALAQLTSELQLLHRRILENECALAKLDERTLSPAIRAGRRKTAASDGCRINADQPLQLPDRR